MKIITSYNVRLKTEYISALKQTVMLYTDAVGFYMDVILEEWKVFAGMSTNEAVLCAEKLSHATTAHPVPKYDFDGRFPKFHVTCAGLPLAVPSVNAVLTTAVLPTGKTWILPSERKLPAGRILPWKCRLSTKETCLCGPVTIPHD